ncbi:hypothetical protein PR001_g14600 [Phytophthora rubi]|uniref:Uncharacterized protein n=1 Tax=Phytophthora rubi TaxID=129364 RepID=A0A6A3LFF7_9STRA|nr:hypothetical protein PR001_g14600 [Phytophthora rubi]
MRPANSSATAHMRSSSATALMPAPITRLQEC